MQSKMYLTYHSATNKGLVRQNNEDHIFLVPDWHFFAIADGMGGHDNGEVASMLACKFTHTFYTDPGNKRIAPFERLRTAMLYANNSVHFYGQHAKLATPKPMGSTLTTLVFHARSAMVGHVGDSRCYRLRNGTLQQLTKDHRGDRPNELLQAIGMEQNVSVDCIVRSCQPKDLFFLCTDGLTAHVGNPEIEVVLCRNPPAQALQFLTDLALKRGGSDNISMILVCVNNRT